jgi:hypothetical protein
VRLFLGLLAGCEQFLLPGCDENCQPIGGQGRIAQRLLAKMLQFPLLFSAAARFCLYLLQVEVAIENYI